MSTPKRITQLRDGRVERRELIDSQCFLRENAESLLRAYRRNQRRSARFWIVLFCVPFSAATWFICLWLTRHFLP